MTLLRWRPLGVSAVVLGLLALAAQGPVEARKDDKPAAKEKDEAAPVYVADLGTAFQLAEHGRASEAPESLLMAARLLRDVARAELKELAAKVEVEGADKEKTKDPEAVAKPDLKMEFKDLIVEAQAMAAKQKMNPKQKTLLSALSRKLEDRTAPAGSAGVVQYLGRTVQGGQTHILHLKATGDEGTDLAIRANAPVLASVIRESNSKVLAATLTAGGNLHFEPNVSERAAPRGVKHVKGGPVKLKHHKEPHHHHHHRDHHHKRRGIDPNGDCPIIIRITNPTDQPIDYTLFLN
jgi:hypothetical protein